MKKADIAYGDDDYAAAAEQTADWGDGLLPIRAVAERIGVSPSTLRAWERRYGLLRPQRTPKGHRLYGPRELLRAQRIRALLDEGHTPASVARLLADAATTAPAQQGAWARYVEATLEAVAAFSTQRLEALFNEASALYPVELVTERLIEPVLEVLGQRWADHPAGIAEEHFYSAWVRNRIGARFHHLAGQARGARIVCAGLPGQHHEIGMLLFAVAAMARGYRVVYLGPDVPLGQVAEAARRSAARGVVLGGRDAVDGQLDRELADLVSALTVPSMIGGPASDAPLARFEEAGGIRLGSRVAVAVRVMASRVPAYPTTRGHSGEAVS